VGTPVAGRKRAEIQGLIGLFVNTLVVRTDLSAEPSFRELLGRVREACLSAHAHQDLPFERLDEELKPERDPSRSPLFQVMFALDPEPSRRVNLPGLTFTTSRIDTGTSKFDLSLHMMEKEGGFEGYLEYSAELFEAATAARLAGHYRTLLEAACADPDAPVARLPLLTAAEREQLRAWNATAVHYPREHRLHRLVEDQARRTPQA